MNVKNQQINSLIERIAVKMNLTKQQVAKKLPILDDLTISVLESSLLEKANEGTEDEFIKCNSNVLNNIKGIMHPSWEDAYSPKRLNDALKDYNSGVTFAFYWNDGYLCWER